MFCPKCEKLICDECHVFHTSTVFTVDHKREQLQLQQLQQSQLQLSSSSSFSSSSSSSSSSSFCSEHSTELINSYCFECSSLSCLRCLLQNHSSHIEKVSPFKESVEKRREKVNEIAFPLEQKANQMKKKKKRNEEKERELKEPFNKDSS